MGAKSEDRNQGEGNVEADRRYRKRTRKFVESARGQSEIDKPLDLSTEEERDLERAEREGKIRAKEEDPNVERDYERPEVGQDKARDKLL